MDQFLNDLLNTLILIDLAWAALVSLICYVRWGTGNAIAGFIFGLIPVVNFFAFGAAIRTEVSQTNIFGKDGS